MAIEFRCTSCGKLLRTQPGTEGKKAKCPECGTILAIPAVPAAGAPPSFEAPPPREPDFAATAPPPPPSSGANPYQSPSVYGAPTIAPKTLRPTRIEVFDALTRTWEIYKANLGACITGAMLSGFLSMSAVLIAWAGFVAMSVQAEGMAYLIGWLLYQVVSNLIAAFFLIGLIMFMLRVARGESPDFGVLFSGGPLAIYGAIIQFIVLLAAWYAPLFAITVVLGVAAANQAPGGLLIALGIVALPFLILYIITLFVMLSLCMFVLVDQRSGIIESFKSSIQVMNGNKATVFTIYVFNFVFGALLTTFTCGIGFPTLFWPFTWLLFAVVYLMVTGQKTILDGPPQEVAERDFGAPGVQPS